MSGENYFEIVISEGMTNILGGPELAGIIFIAFFLGFVTIQNTRIDHKLAIITPVMILSIVFFNWFAILLAFLGGFVFYLALKRWFGQ